MALDTLPPPPRPGTYPTSYREFSGQEGALKTVVVPFAIGRNRIKPVAIFNSQALPAEMTKEGWRTLTTFEQKGTDTEQLMAATGAVDAVLAFCQAGDADHPVSLVGLWRGKAYVGQRWSGKAWTSVGTSVWRALRRLMRSKDVGGRWEMNGASSAKWVNSNTFQAAPHELILSTASPYGKRYVGPLDAYSDITGSYPPWSYLAGSSLEGCGFYGLTHLRAEQLALDTMIDTALPSIEALIDTYGGPEVHPVVAVRAVLERLIGEPSGSIETDHGPDGRTESSFQAWCDSNPDLRVNGLVDGTPKSALDEILGAVNAEMVQSNGKICIWPLGDAVVGAYQPAYFWSGAWHPTVIDRREIQGGIEVRITDESEVFNCQTVKYLDRARDYKENVQTDIHRWHAGQYGRREGSVITSKWISTSNAANKLAQFTVRRSINQRKRLKARLCPRWYELQVGDLLELGDGVYTGGAWTDVIGVPGTLCRIAKKSRRGDDGSFEIEAWAWSYGATQPIDLTPDEPAAPVMIEPAATADDAHVIAQLTLAAGTGTNILPNGDFSAWDDENGVPAGWGGASGGAVWSLSGGGLNHPSGDYSLLRNLNRYNTQYLNAPWYSQGAPLGDPNRYYYDWWSSLIPVEPGRRYCASAHLGAIRCRTAVFVYWNDALGNVIGVTYGPADTSENTDGVDSKYGGPTIGDWKRCYSLGVASAGAVSAKVTIRKMDTVAGQGGSYIIMTRAQFEELKDGSTGPGPWSPPAANGTAVKAGADAADAKSVAAAAHDAAMAAARADLQNVNPGAITSTLIADDAITTPKIGARAVVAEHISVDTLAAISADLGTVRAGTLDITGDLYLGSKLARELAQVVARGRIYTPVPGNWGVDGAYGIAGVSRVDRGSGSVPRYVVRVTLTESRPAGSLVMLSSSPQESTGGTLMTYHDVTPPLWPQAYIDIGCYAGGAWSDPVGMSGCSFLLFRTL